MKNFFAHTDSTRKEILDEISLNSVEELFEKIPTQARVKKFDLPEALSEIQLQREVKTLAGRNKTDYINFLGAGTYNRFVPAAISHVAQRFEFLTAYTPYQPEISQGTLQVMYEYQSMICNLCSMDVANASVYDGATACAEAILMASRITKREKALVSKALNPQYIDVIETYCSAIGIQIDWLEVEGLETDFSSVEEKIQNGEYACVLVQNPNFFGSIEDLFKLGDLLENDKTLFVVSVDITSLSTLASPGEYKADIVVGDVQSLGIPMSFGGPHGGFMACKEKFMRQLPGRITGKSLDSEGKDAYTLTIQTREQHIKREKATSNICSNQALIALCATLYLTLLGENGFRQVGFKSAQNAHVLSKKLLQKGVKTLNKNFYNEFVIEVADSDAFLKELKSRNVLGGVKLDENKVLVATTEMISDEDIELYAQF